MNVLITGANGFVGKNLTQRLSTIKDRRDRTRPALQIEEILFVYAGYFGRNPGGLLPEGGFRGPLGWREPAPESGRICSRKYRLHPYPAGDASKSGNRCPVLLSSSIQASLTGRYAGSPYGQSKKRRRNCSSLTARKPAQPG